MIPVGLGSRLALKPSGPLGEDHRVRGNEIGRQ
jgi:hypothetical protein